MASIGRSGKRWRAQVARDGIRKSKTFATKQEARDWAASIEADLQSAKSATSRLKFSEVMDRYAREVSSKKRGARWEQVRLERFKKDPIGKIQMCDLATPDLVDWRERRLREVSPGTVKRERVLLSAVLTQARKEWKLISENPMSDVKAPKEPPARDRLVTDKEIERMVALAGTDLKTKRARAVHAFRFAVETGMRAKEVLSLTLDDVDTQARVARLTMTKNGDNREVPLTTEAVRLLDMLGEDLFDLSSQDLDVSFRAVRDRAGIQNLTFHDSRHSAVTRLAKKLKILDLARAIGHRDIRQLMVYYNEPVSEIAKQLD